MMVRCLGVLALAWLVGGCARMPDDLAVAWIEPTTYDELPHRPYPPHVAESVAALRRWNDARARGEAGGADGPASDMLRALRVRFTSKTNLPLKAIDDRWRTTLHSDFCDRSQVDVLLTQDTFYFGSWHSEDFSSMAADAARPEPRSRQPGDGLAPDRMILLADGLYYYDVYVFAQGRESGHEPHPTRAYNLRDEPHAVCFYLETFVDYFEQHTSNTVRIPKEAIAAALRGRRVEIGD